MITNYENIIYFVLEKLFFVNRNGDVISSMISTRKRDYMCSV